MLLRRKLMSANGTKRTSKGVQPMSAFGGKADIYRHKFDVWFWPDSEVPLSLFQLIRAMWLSFITFAHFST